MTDCSREDEWLAVGAFEKARSVIELVEGRSVQRVLEVGSGSGAVLRELDHAGFGGQYWACEPSAKLYNLLVRKGIGRLVGAYPTTLEDSPLVHDDFDLAILSHVLEHVVAPAKLLAHCLEIAPLVVVEVPLEANLAGRLRAALMRRPRRPNAAGHVHFFSRRSAYELVSHAGGRVVGSRAYFPQAAYEHQANDALRQAIARTARRFPTLGRAYHAHLALLIVPRRVDRGEAHDLFYGPA